MSTSAAFILQNYYSKEPDFQIGITEEACN